MLEVLGRNNSINVRKVLWLCEELGLPCVNEPWGTGALQLQSPKYRALNPNGLVRKSPAHQDAAAIQTSQQQWQRHMKIAEVALSHTGAYMAGATFTLADVVIGLAVQRWFMTPMDHPPLPAVAAYFERLSARLGFLKHGRNGMP